MSETPRPTRSKERRNRGIRATFAALGAIAALAACAQPQEGPVSEAAATPTAEAPVTVSPEMQAQAEARASTEMAARNIVRLIAADTEGAVTETGADGAAKNMTLQDGSTLDLIAVRNTGDGTISYKLTQVEADGSGLDQVDVTLFFSGDDEKLTADSLTTGMLAADMTDTSFDPLRATTTVSGTEWNVIQYDDAGNLQYSDPASPPHSMIPGEAERWSEQASEIISQAAASMGDSDVLLD